MEHSSSIYCTMSNRPVSDVQRLIEMVQQEPIIWDKLSNDYGRRDVLQSVWSRIGATIGCTPEEAKSVWVKLRHRFMREVRMVRQASDQRGVYVSPWRYYLPMGFLHGCTNQRRLSPTGSKPGNSNDQSSSFLQENGNQQSQSHGFQELDDSIQDNRQQRSYEDDSDFVRLPSQDNNGVAATIKQEALDSRLARRSTVSPNHNVNITMDRESSVLPTATGVSSSQQSSSSVHRNCASPAIAVETMSSSPDLSVYSGHTADAHAVPKRLRRVDDDTGAVCQYTLPVNRQQLQSRKRFHRMDRDLAVQRKAAPQQTATSKLQASVLDEKRRMLVEQRKYYTELRYKNRLETLKLQRELKLAGIDCPEFKTQCQ